MELIRDIVKVRSRCCIILDQGGKYWLLTSDLSEASYAPGQEVDEEELSRFVLIRQYPRALNESVSMLARRPCGKGEIEQKLLQKHYSARTVEMVLYKLEKEKLLNDAEFSEQWARYRAGQKYGKRRIYQELRYKGVSEEDTQAALESLDEDETFSQAVELASKSFRRAGPEDDSSRQLQKAVQSLVRRGYDWETAKEACRQALLDLQSDMDVDR